MLVARVPRSKNLGESKQGNAAYYDSTSGNKEYACKKCSPEVPATQAEVDVTSSRIKGVAHGAVLSECIPRPDAGVAAVFLPNMRTREEEKSYKQTSKRNAKNGKRNITLR